MTVYALLGQVPLGKLLGMPWNTMFHELPDQPPHWVLRVYHCCCEPLSTVPSIIESDIQPPLAQPLFACNNTPALRTCMRRNGFACDTAHFRLAPGVTEKFSRPRQKLQVALLLSRYGSE